METGRDAEVTVCRIEAMDTALSGHFARARASLGVESFGLSILSLSPDFDGYPEHTHESDRQEEVLVVLDGSATLLVDGGEPIALDRETLVRIGWRCRRRVVAGPQGVRFLAIGGRPGHAYGAPPFSEVGAPDSARRAGPGP